MKDKELSLAIKKTSYVGLADYSLPTFKFFFISQHAGASFKREFYAIPRMNHSWYFFLDFLKKVVTFSDSLSKYVAKLVWNIR